MPRIKGRKISAPKPIQLAFPRGEDEPIVLTIGAVMSYERFEQLCPDPKPPVIMKPGRPPFKDFNSPTYQRKVEAHGVLRGKYMILHSLLHTEDFQFETVNPDDPATWDNLDAELQEAFTQPEIGMIYQAVFNVNAPNEEARKQALENFSALQAAEQSDSTSQTDEPSSTSSGEPVSAGG